jgi:membrane-associated phospholipid phosphatase
MRIAQITSYIFHPILMPVIGLVIILNSGIYSVELPADFRKYLYLMTILCTLVLPLSFLPVLLYFRYVKEISLGERRERLIPLFFTTICFYTGYYFISRLSPVKVINLFLLSATLVVMLLLVISLFWKISIHAAGIGGITGLIMILSVAYTIDMTVLLSSALLISGFIIAARLALNTHTPLQLITGYVLGIASVIGLMVRLMVR